ncbi:MAG TPA: hypothetical protein VIM58_02265, partial [Candidatus Methylacidiphilales bacterium]
MAGSSQFRLLRFHERRQVRDRLLHHACGLDDLRQKHLACAKEVTHNAHACHQRAFNHGKGAPKLLPRLFR